MTRRISRPARVAIQACLVILGMTGCAGIPMIPAEQPGSFPAGPPPIRLPIPGQAGPTPGPGQAPGLPPGDGRVAPPAGEAAIALVALPVKGRAPLTGYTRARFGQAWTDVDGDGCDQRNQVLARDMVDEVFKRGTHNCVVATGVLHDPYTGKVISFRRGNKTSEAVQIDHVVALANAWRSGAGQLDQQTLLQLANDPLNLLAVDGPTNQSKGDSDAATWLPPNKAFRCEYVSRQVAVKQRYRLWVIPAERTAMEKVLAGCAGQPLLISEPLVTARPPATG
jgi:hypothetical protein